MHRVVLKFLTGARHDYLPQLTGKSFRVWVWVEPAAPFLPVTPHSHPVFSQDKKGKGRKKHTYVSIASWKNNTHPSHQELLFFVIDPTLLLVNRRSKHSLHVFHRSCLGQLSSCLFTLIYCYTSRLGWYITSHWDPDRSDWLIIVINLESAPLFKSPFNSSSHSSAL